MTPSKLQNHPNVGVVLFCGGGQCPQTNLSPAGGMVFALRVVVTESVPYIAWSVTITRRAMNIPTTFDKFAHRGSLPFPTEITWRDNGQVAIGTGEVEFWGKPVAHVVFKIFRNCEFPKTGKLALYIGKIVFFEQNLYKVFGFQWTNRKICCIIISFLCCGRKAVIYWKR